MPEPLNTFEEDLLGQLQQHLDTQPSRSPRRFLVPAVGGAVAAGILMVAGALVSTRLAAQPAWAVEPHGGGSVQITINRPEGAEALTQRLQELGIRADIQFPPDGQQCAPGRITASNQAKDADAQTVTQASLGNRVQLTVVPAAFVEGTTLVIEVDTLARISDTESAGIHAHFGTVHATPPPCHLVPLTPADFEPSSSPSR